MGGEGESGIKKDPHRCESFYIHLSDSSIKRSRHQTNNLDFTDVDCGWAFLALLD